MHDPEADVRAIQELIHRQFASMTWKAGYSPDLAKFKADFLADADLYPSARPLSVLTLEQFGSRMSELARTSLASFHERIVAANVHVFGGVAVATVACENTENETEVNRNVEMMLLVKENGHWKIAAQAWDRETPSCQIPATLLADL
jgi:hypothetical protein